MITSLKKNQIFVFGSNLSGWHSGGAALQAKKNFHAKEGVGEGLTGQCYAFPTLGIGLGTRMDRGLKTSVKKFFAVVRKNPEKEFLLTKVGCGIAGYPEERMKMFFRNAPQNVVKPIGW